MTKTSARVIIQPKNNNRKGTKMLLFYIRHGDPIYNPNMLTPLGEAQARAVAKRLSLYGLDKIYASPSTRAMQTAQPTADLTKLPIIEADFADEKYAWGELTVPLPNEKRTWLFQHPETRKIFASQEIRKLGEDWSGHPDFLQYKDGINRAKRNTDAFLASLGYEHDREAGIYKVTRDNNERIALFAHQGFGLAFLSALLDIPYPALCMHFNMSHSDMTVIEFKNEGGYAIPCVLSLSNDSHLYKEGIATKYENRIYF